MVDLFRILVVVFLVMHAVTHVLYFVASWTSIRTGFGSGAWILPGDFTIRGVVGKAWGIGGLLVTVLFLLGAFGLLAGEAAWVRPTNLGIFLSFGVVVPWWRRSPGSIGVWAVFANLALMFLLAVPLAEELTAA